MIGTDKQTAFALTVIAGAKAWYSSSDATGAPIDRDGSQMAAIEVVEAVERGDMEAAEAALEKAARWIELAIEVGPEPKVKAGAVIDALKGAYYCARDKGLVA